MKFFVSIVLIAVLSFALSLFFPWWIIIIPSFIVARLIRQNPGRAFISGFLSLFLLWGIFATVLSINNNHILAGKASLLILKSGNPWMLILITAMIGGLISGLSSLSSSLLINKK